MSRLEAATFAALLAWSMPAAAEFPEKPVDYIIPFGAGGESGITARLQQPVFMKLTGQDLVVKYRPGGGGAVAWSQLNEMPDDGHTLIGVNLPHILLQPSRGANYKTEDLGIVHIFHYTPHAILVRDESQYKTLEDLIKVMNAKPGKVSFSGSGRGTANHLAQVWFDERLRAKSAYNGKKGTAAAVAALLDEQVDASWAYTTGAVKYGDKLRMLAVAMEKRHPKFPDVPTFRELGYDFVGGAYRGVAVPKSTTEKIRLKISELFGRIGDDPAFKARKSELGFVPLSVGYIDIPAFMTSRRVEYLPLAREAGLIE
jgi:tripartite-type tricarboxylate transporter receptor subunit TctC